VGDRYTNNFLTKSKKGLFLQLPYLWPMDQSMGFLTISTPFFETAFVQWINHLLSHHLFMP